MEDPQALLAPGTKPGQHKFIREGGAVVAYSWDVTSWQVLGLGPLMHSRIAEQSEHLFMHTATAGLKSSRRMHAWDGASCIIPYQIPMHDDPHSLTASQGHMRAPDTLASLLPGVAAVGEDWGGGERGGGQGGGGGGSWCGRHQKGEG